MTKMVVSFANGLASRTSRRSFLGRTGKLAVGLVGGSALLALMTETAQASSCPGCSNPCFHWNTCDCWGNPWKSATTTTVRAVAGSTVNLVSARGFCARRTW
jgi:hypothetical protein